jgi:iron(III) transport system permease protein
VLAVLECMNDLGAVQHLGIRTLSTSIYTSWLQRNDLVGAVQIAAILMLIVLAILGFERSMRGGGRGHATTTRYRSLPFETLTGWRSVAALAACFAPVLAGFVVPVAILVRHALLTGIDGSATLFWIAVRNSIGLAAAASVITVLLAIALIGARRAARGSITAGVGLLAGLGYALPGTVLAIGLMRPLGAFDNWIGYGLLISGSLAAVVLAYVIRFMAVALGPIEDGQSRISPNLDAAARTLGANEFGALVRVQLPMMVPAIGAAALVVFVDSMKELPATLLLRPLGFSTLATEVFNLAALEQIEASAAYALTIVATGLIPVLLLHRAIASGRAGG